MRTSTARSLFEATGLADHSDSPLRLVMAWPSMAEAEDWSPTTCPSSYVTAVAEGGLDSPGMITDSEKRESSKREETIRSTGNSVCSLFSDCSALQPDASIPNMLPDTPDRLAVVLKRKEDTVPIETGNCRSESRFLESEH